MYVIVNKIDFTFLKLNNKKPLCKIQPTEHPNRAGLEPRVKISLIEGQIMSAIADMKLKVGIRYVWKCPLQPLISNYGPFTWETVRFYRSVNNVHPNTVP
jgi:hypothetical protein